MEIGKTDQEIFGENLRLLRKVHRLSQKSMARIMGTSVYCVRKTEQGTFPRSLGISAILRLSRQFHLRPAKLFAPQEEWNMKLLLNGEEDT